MATNPIIDLPSDLPPPVKEVSMLQMNDPRSPFLYDAVNSKKVDPPCIRSGEFMVQHADIAKELKEKRETLVQKVPDVEFFITHFENWGTTIASLLLYVKPKTRQEVCDIIKAAKNINIKVGMGGAYHTWSPSYPDSGGLLINTCDIVLEDQTISWTQNRMRLNTEKNRVTIVPGVTTGQLMQFFLDNDVTFKSDVILPSVTYGGVFSGGCHGVGKSQTTMSDWITSMTVVDGNGDIKQIPEDYVLKCDDVTPEDVLSAASASLGLFGVIVEITIRVEPMGNASVRNVFSHKMELLRKDHKDELATLLQTTESLEVFWFPFNSIFDSFLKKDHLSVTLTGITDKELKNGRLIRQVDTFDWIPWNDDLWSREIDFTSEAVTKDPGVPISSMIMDVIAGGAMSIANKILGSMINYITPLTLALAFKMLKYQYGCLQKDEVVKIPWAVHYRDAIDMNYAYDMEFAFPIDIQDPWILNEAVQIVVDHSVNFSSKGLFYEDTKETGVTCFPFNLCMEFRVMKKSKALLCPASIGDKDYILYIEVLSTVNTPGVKSFFENISDGWKKLGGIPHWQKQWTFLDKNGSMVNYLKEKYGENLTKFKDVRDLLNVDPNNMFVNSVYSHFLE